MFCGARDELPGSGGARRGVNCCIPDTIVQSLRPPAPRDTRTTSTGEKTDWSITCRVGRSRPQSGSRVRSGHLGARASLNLVGFTSSANSPDLGISGRRMRRRPSSLRASPIRATSSERRETLRGRSSFARMPHLLFRAGTFRSWAAPR